MQADTENAENETLGTRSEVEVMGACKRRLKAFIPVDKVREELERSYREFGDMVQLPGLVGVAPGSGLIMIPPVSVCHQVSTMGQRSPPTTV